MKREVLRFDAFILCMLSHSPYTLEQIRQFCSETMTGLLLLAPGVPVGAERDFRADASCPMNREVSQSWCSWADQQHP